MRHFFAGVTLMAALALTVPASAGTATRPNEFVEVGSDQGGIFFSQVIYAPPIKGLVSWGTRVHGQPIRTHETQHFLIDENKWIDAFPPDKAEAWAKQPYKAWGDWNYCSGMGFFYDRDGVRMPRPNTAFYQVTWDEHNQRLLYYLGSMTFAYDPVKRAWKLIYDKNVKAQPPALLIWGSICYEPVNKQVLLFGGGAIDAPDGNPHTWALDVTTDTWRKLDLEVEPPARCNSRMVYDKKNRLIVLFGGDGQDRGLADTWVFDVTKQKWQERKPERSPHPRWNHALAYLDKSGVVLLAGGVAQAPWQQVKDLSQQTWVYDAAKNTWTPLAVKPPLAPWVSMENVPGTDEVVYVTSDKHAHGRKTYRFLYDSSAKVGDAKGVPPGTFAYKTTATKEWFEAVPPKMGSDPNEKTSRGQTPFSAADPKAHEKEIADLPVNEWVEMKPPKTTNGRTWGTGLFDTHLGFAMKWGGGHSGYQGTDMAFYDVAANRFTIDRTAAFTPDPFGADAARPMGRTYFNQPWARHVRHTCAYDQVRRLGVFTDAGGSDWYDRNADKTLKHTWLYDPAKRAWLEPIVQPFPGGSAVSPIAFTTPTGVMVYHGGKLWRFIGEAGKPETFGWEEIKLEGAARPPQNEMMTIVFDEKRERLIFLSRSKEGPELWFLSLRSPSPSQGEGRGEGRGMSPSPSPLPGRERDAGSEGPYRTWVKNPAPAPGGVTSREAVYFPGQDAVLAYGPAQKDDPVWTRVYLCAANRWVPLAIKTPQRMVYEVGLEYDPARQIAVFLWYPSFEAGIRPHLFRLDVGKLPKS